MNDSFRLWYGAIEHDRLTYCSSLPHQTHLFEVKRSDIRCDFNGSIRWRRRGRVGFHGSGRKKSYTVPVIVVGDTVWRVHNVILRIFSAMRVAFSSYRFMISIVVEVSPKLSNGVSCYAESLQILDTIGDVWRWRVVHRARRNYSKLKSCACEGPGPIK